MELGNILFGHSRGEYPIENRNIVNSKAWQNLLEICNCDSYGYYCGFNKNKTELGGYENEMFAINPYYWGEEERLMEIPNFLYKPTGLIIEWYKYPFRDSYMNKNLNDRQLKAIWTKCYNYMKGRKNCEI